MSQKQKNTSILSYVAKQRRKESKEKKHEQESDSSRPTCSSFASQSTEFDFAEERINLDTPNIASDDIPKIFPPNGSNNVDKLHLLKIAFCPVGESAMAFDFRNAALLKENDFVISTKSLQNIFMVGMF